MHHDHDADAGRAELNQLQALYVEAEQALQAAPSAIARLRLVCLQEKTQALRAGGEQALPPADPASA